MPDLPRILIVDDHPIMRRGIESTIESRFQLVGSADEIDAAVDLIIERAPDLVVLDVNLKDGHGATVVRRVKPALPETKFLVLTVSSSKEDVMRMFQMGIDGYIVKSSEGADLLDAIQQTLDNERPVSRAIAGYLLDIDEDVADESGIDRLTPKEREVTKLIARGYSYREIAGRLSRPISVKTLENHVAHIFQKLEVASRHQVARLAYETGLVSPEDDPAD